MSHFAKVVSGRVVSVIAAEPEFFDTFVDSTPGEWIQTSYNTHGNVHALGGTPLRANYAGIGYFYNPRQDVFYEPQPFPSWILDTASWLWQAPVNHPNDGKLYNWDETTQSWIEA
jgi:hypothetical protein